MTERQFVPMLTGVFAACLLALATACGNDTVEPSAPPTPVPTTITISPASATFQSLGETAQLTAEVRDQNGQTMANAAVAWTSSDPSVATVAASGLVTAVANGAATVTATAGSASGTVAVTVDQVVASVAVDPAADTLPALGDTLRLSAEALDANGNAVAGEEFAWESSDVSVATVDASGLVTAVANGVATVTATAGSASGSAAVTVDQVVASVAVNPASDTLPALGDTLRLSAEALDANGNAVAGEEFAWESSDVSVATVDASGLVTAVANGVATVTATAGSTSGGAAVTVDQVVASVAVDPAADTLPALGDTLRLSAEALDANGNVVADAEFAWESSDPSVATVDATGLVTAAANGAATVTATAGSASGTAAVTVAQEVTAVIVSPSTDTVLVTETVRLSAEAADANGHTASAEFAWASDDTRVAAVDQEGVVTGVSIGEAEITVTSGSLSDTAIVLVGRTVSVSLSSVPTNGGVAVGAGEWLWLPDSPVTTTLMAQANPGYDFDGWVAAGNVLSTDSLHLMDVSGNHEIGARFSVNQQKGKWTPGGTYTWYAFEAGDYGVDSISWTFLPVRDPPQSLADKGLLHYYAMNFGVTNSISGFGRGYAGLQTNGLMHGKQWGKSINFSIWGSNASRTDGQTEKDNFECKCHRILYEFSWKEGTAYRFVLKAGPSGTEPEGKWWGLWVTDVASGSATFLGEQRVPTTIQGRPATTLSPRDIHVFGEDLYWWLAAPGHVKYVCSDFDPSSVAIIDVRAGARRPTRIRNITNGGRTFTNPNGYVAVGCHVTITDGGQGDVQHNLGFWPEPPRNAVGGAAGQVRD